MRDYAKLAPTFWTRGSGKKLRKNPFAQVVAMYLSTSPGANMIGIYYVPIDTIAHDTGITATEVSDALIAIETAGYAKYDHDAELVWVMNHAKIEIGAELKRNDKRRGRVMAELAHVDDHPFHDQFIDRYGEAFGFEARRVPDAHSSTAESTDFAKGHPRSQEGASGQPEGASAIPGQDRAGQDRAVTGQDRTGQARARDPDRRFEPGSAGAVEAKHGYESAIADATGRTFAFPRAPFHIADLCDLLNKHAVTEPDKPAAIAWLGTTISEWVKACEGKSAVGWQPSKLLDWLNGGRVSARDRGGGTKRGAEITKQPFDENAPWMKVGT